MERTSDLSQIYTSPHQSDGHRAIRILKREDLSLAISSLATRQLTDSEFFAFNIRQQPFDFLVLLHSRKQLFHIPSSFSA